MNRTSRAQFKRQIAASFGAKVSGYAKNAIIQQQLLDHLTPYIMEHSTPDSLWIDAGCGNGSLEEKLRATHFKNTIVALDIANASVQYGARHSLDKNNHWLCADIESPPIKPCSATGVVSASVLQWFPKMDAVLNTIQTLLKDNGVFVFSIFTDKAFHELAEIRSRFGLPQPVICPQPDNLLAMFASNNLITIKHEHISEKLYFPSAMDLLRHLSAIGSTSLPSIRLSRNKLQQFCNEFEDAFRTSEGIPLTYEALIGVCKKGGSNA